MAPRSEAAVCDGEEATTGKCCHLRCGRPGVSAAANTAGDPFCEFRNFNGLGF